MPTRSSTGKDHDFAVNARRVVEQVIGELLDGTPLENPDEGKNPHAVALGRFGGQDLSIRRMREIPAILPPVPRGIRCQAAGRAGPPAIAISLLTSSGFRAMAYCQRP